MFCTKCGSKVSDTAKFCNQCGEMVMRNTVPYNEYEFSDVEEEKNETEFEVNTHNESEIELEIEPRIERKIEQEELENTEDITENIENNDYIKNSENCTVNEEQEVVKKSPLKMIVLTLLAVASVFALGFGMKYIQEEQQVKENKDKETKVETTLKKLGNRALGSEHAGTVEYTHGLYNLASALVEERDSFVSYAKGDYDNPKKQ